MAVCKTCSNCALKGNTWANTCSSPRQINKKGDCIWWESKDFWTEVCADIREPKDEPYIGKHIKPTPIKYHKNKVPIFKVKIEAGNHG